MSGRIGWPAETVAFEIERPGFSLPRANQGEVLIRIANGQGFWGDWLEAPRRLVQDGPIDYLALDYLSEVTMSILEKQRRRNPGRGYAADFVDLAVSLLPRLASDGIKIVTNAGGVNPEACAEAILAGARSAGVRGTRIAVVSGDDIGHRIDEIASRGVRFDDIDTGRPLEAIRGDLLSAHVYIGGFPLAEALGTGANIVVAGRSTDSALALAPMIHEFGWQASDWDRLAAGTVAGHLIECGAQCTGGNCSLDWQSIPDMANIGFPVVEAGPSGDFVVTKHPRTGGRVTVASVKEQLLYELGDPRAYLTPDCRVDFTSVQLRPDGPDRVAVEGVQGGPRPPTLKTSLTYSAGFQAVGTLVYSWPQAVEKARAAERIVRRRLEDLGLCLQEVHGEILGAGACHGPAAKPATDPPEVVLRMGVRAAERDPVERFSREMIPLVLNGPPTATGFGEGRPRVRQLVAHHASLLPRDEISTSVRVFE